MLPRRQKHKRNGRHLHDIHTNPFPNLNIRSIVKGINHLCYIINDIIDRNSIFPKNFDLVLWFLSIDILTDIVFWSIFGVSYSCIAEGFYAFGKGNQSHHCRWIIPGSLFVLTPWAQRPIPMYLEYKTMAIKFNSVTLCLHSEIDFRITLRFN